MIPCVNPAPLTNDRLLPDPELSADVVPLPSSNVYRATGFAVMRRRDSNPSKTTHSISRAPSTPTGKCKNVAFGYTQRRDPAPHTLRRPRQSRENPPWPQELTPPV